MKVALKSAGLIGPESKARKVSKSRSQKDQVAAASARKDAKVVLRTMATTIKEGNPFEMKFAKQKHDIIGRKVKGSIGRPGQTKKKSEDIRQKTLLVEMKNRNRESALIDRRIGEHDPNMSIEDKMLERFMREKTQRSGKSTMFNIDSEEQELTHMGQSLSNFSSFDDAGFERVDDSDDDGNIDAKIVKYTHFGGFEEDKADPDSHKSRNEIMKEVMAKSKMHKRERQRQKEVDLEIQDSLDADLEEIRGMLVPMSEKPVTEGRMVISSDRAKLISGEIAVRPSEVKAPFKGHSDIHVEFNPPPQPKLDDDYDKFVRELAYDRRAKPTDRIKNEDEIAQSEKNKLEKLEKERIRRMQGEDAETVLEKKRNSKKRSAQADDLGDVDYGVHIDNTVSREAKLPLTYKDGKLVNEKIFMSNGNAEYDSQEEDESETDDDTDNSDDSDDGDTDSDAESDEDDSDESVASNESEADAVKVCKPKTKRAERDTSLEPDFEIIDEDDLDAGQYESNFDEDAEFSNEDDSNADSSDNDSSSLKESDAPSRLDDDDQVPFTMNAPSSLDELLELIDGKSVTFKQTAIKRLRILNNVRLGPEYKKRLAALSAVLLEYRDYVTALVPSDIESLKALEGHTVELGRQFCAQTAEFSLQRIASIQDSFIKSMATGSKKKIGFPSLSDLYFFRIVGEIFSTSDLQHIVVTPTILIMGQFLAQCPISTAQDAMSGLFLCEIFTEYICLSRRYVPEIVNFLNRICASCLAVKSIEITSHIPLPSMINPILAIKDFSVEPALLRVSTIPLFAKSKFLTESVKVSLLAQAAHLLSNCSRIWNETGCNIEIFEATVMLLKLIPQSDLSEKSLQFIKKAQDNIVSQITSAALKRRPLQMQKRKAIAITTYVPKFQEGYSHDRRYDPDRERAENAKVRSQFKKEQKGAERELRKDSAFVARQQLQDTKEKDAAYKKKMDKIMGQLSSQEGAMRGVERTSKKPKRKH
ncbi:hypothetical protein BSLG_004894 [Batrachochytrium salamandrivorans]|nr:hypothetical protein BSLG_004894 [Batrachochytrium salamandrivorans]